MTTYRPSLPEPDRVRGLLADALADPSTAWSVGTFGAIAEFMRDPDERVTDVRGDRLGLITERGAIAFHEFSGVRPIAYETPTSRGSWSHALALCLRETECAGNGRMVVTELGPDAGALRPTDRRGFLFDLGLGTVQVDVCVRTFDPEALRVLRAGLGRSLFDPANPIAPRLAEMSPHRVFVTRIGRAEVFQRIPPPDGTSPDGPHTHVLPNLLKTRRTHAATACIPEGWVPCAHIHPPHPARDANGRARAFDQAHADAFAALFRTYADPELIRLKEDILAAMAAQADPAQFTLSSGKAARLCIRTTLRQLKAGRLPPASLDPWTLFFDRRSHDAVEDEAEHC